MLGRALLPASLLLVAGVLVLAGCENAHARRGDELMKVGDFDGAVDEYSVAATETGKREVVDKRKAAEQAAADVHFKRATDRSAARDLEGAVAELEVAVRLNPANPQAREYLEAARKKRDEVRGVAAAARAALEAGDPVAAVEALDPIMAYAPANPDLATLADRARRKAAAALRERAAARLAKGEIEGANADLERAGRLESASDLARAGEKSLKAGIAPVSAEGRGAGAAPGAAGGDEAPVGAAALDEYARAAEEVKRLTSELPRRAAGASGIAKPEDYALADDDVARLEAAIIRCNTTKPFGERLPTWLAHARICLRMAKDVAVAKRVDAARKQAESGDAGAAWTALCEARRLDGDAVGSAENADGVAVVQRAVVSRLLDIARRDLASGYVELARLRARQAREVAPGALPEADALLERADAQAGPPPVVVMPFQNYTSSETLAERFHARLLARLAKPGVGPVIAFAEFQRRKASGLPAPAVGIVKGDLVRLDAQDARDVKAEADARVARSKAALEEARRRLDATADGGARARARAAVEEAERAVARAERDRAATLFAGPDRPDTTSPVAGRLTVTVEARFALHDPAAGRDVVTEPIVKIAEGSTQERAALEDRAIDAAVEPVAAAVEARLYDLARAERAAAASDPNRILDAKVGALEKAKDAPDAAAAAAVLEATGYSYVERRTIPGQLRLD
jgi:hypothetical protein